MCFGTFDNFHPGHLNYLQASKNLGDYLIVVVARDKNVFKIKGKEPKQNELERLQQIKKNNFVDKVVLGNIKNRLAVIEKYKPKILSFGYDQFFNEKAIREVFSGEIVIQKSFKPSVYKSSKINYVKRKGK